MSSIMRNGALTIICIGLFGVSAASAQESGTAQVHSDASTVGAQKAAKNTKAPTDAAKNTKAPREAAKAIAPAPKTVAASLTEAYKREFSFLEAEKVALKKRLTSVRTKSAGRAGGLKAQNRTLEAAITELEAKAEALEKAILSAENREEDESENDELLTDALTRAQAAFESAGLAVKEVPEDYNKRIEMIGDTFAQSVTWLKTASSVQVVDGGFFLDDGNKVEGKLVRLGQVATYGVSKEAAGVLAPAGDGHLWLWPAADTADVAKRLAAGEAVATLPLFLYETLQKRVEKPEEKTWRDTVESGGVIAWVIVYLGLVGVALVVLRALVLWWLGLGTRRALARVRKAIAGNDVTGALKTLRWARTSAARVSRAALKAWDRDEEHLERVVNEQLLREVPRVEFLGSIITVVASVAPLLGLLGTVTGMISTFDIITEHGTGDPKLLSGGISEALITTELGLIVAIPILLLGTLLSAQANGLLSTLERSGLSLLNQLDDMRLRLDEADGLGPIGTEWIGASLDSVTPITANQDKAHNLEAVQETGS
ncbi:MAG: MotA/TolQ/ExbB proton channel family protein [Myxococcota bacterium]|nr:MotA/TolQ/ExbB proton channel family protein [Myxococcota bacterium]